MPTYLLDDRDVRADVLSRLDQLVLKPVDVSGGYGLVIGPQASDEVLSQLAIDVAANPRGWIAQEVVTLSTSPTHIGDRLAPRHIDLRPFAVNDGHKVWVAPGGLTRVALPEGSLVVNSSQGGGSKDTWVLTSGLPAAPDPESLWPASSVATDHFGWPTEQAPTDTGAEGQQEQQQQQGGFPC